MVSLVIILGTIVGSLSDPLFISGILIAAALGASRLGWVVGLGVAVLFAFLRLNISQANRAVSGLDGPNVYVPIATFLAFAVVWLAAAGIRRMVSR